MSFRAKKRGSSAEARQAEVWRLSLLSSWRQGQASICFCISTSQQRSGWGRSSKALIWELLGHLGWGGASETGLRGQRWDPVGVEESGNWVPASKRVPLTRLGLGLNFKWSKKPEASRMVTEKQVPGQPSREVRTQAWDAQCL